MANVDISSFHEYDIRGIYPTAVDENFYYHLGKALALYQKIGPISVAHDTRLSSPSLSEALIRGITDYGVDVIDLGLTSTEANYFANGKHKFPMSVIVTASHNPKEYNGAKIAQYSPDGIVPICSLLGFAEIKKLIIEDPEKPGIKGKITKQEIMDEWIDHVLSCVDSTKLTGLKIVVDSGNGMGGPTWKELSKRLQCTFDLMYNEPDGNFPNHLADPSKAENRAACIARVKELNADIGILIDGDADRLYLIDETGAVVSGTVTTALLASYFLPKRQGTYCYNAICGRVVPEMIRAAGSVPFRTEVGHSLIKTHMRELKAVMAGEHSGHFFFGRNNNSESSAIAALIVLEIMKDREKKLSELRMEYDRYPVSGEINFKIEDRVGMMKRIEDTFSSKADSVDKLDGVSVWFKDYWFNVRGSNTEPLLRLNIEANTTEILTRVTDELVNLLTINGAVRK